MSFQRFLQDKYPAFKAQYGDARQRRRTRLRVVEDFWKLDPHARANLPPTEEQSDTPHPYEIDEDTYDDIASSDAPNLGIIVRTDYTNEDAWQTFYLTLIEAEQEFMADSVPSQNSSDAPLEPVTGALPDSDVDMADGTPEDAEEGEGDDDGDEPLAFFAVLSDESLTGISNLSALRLVNDVDVGAAPLVPAGEKRISPGHRLVDLSGLQEVYKGKTVWVYDSKSNVDRCAQLYGTATGDSWRARASHITELQVNLATGVMKIDFGGLDRYDYLERRRNLEEANRPL
ncbi:hypothetical protein BV25DRAFT_1870055 [Artomyces pyxidatus]|uniref:Uncharacterized protein n=1 Tax=Artomyces pyxidatus TaxID=48021 RepID=A0ACB8T420_9AGAM|nr:hypothetical protein BV25DRAFT_1870055 [Artomyces pyxidatus]